MTGAGGRPRIQQMADDLGISYKEAKALMAESRKNVSPAVKRVLKGFNREGADRIAQEDTKMVLKRKAGGAMTNAEIAERKRKTRKERPSDYGGTIGGGGLEEVYPESVQEYMDTAPKQQVKLERRGDKKKVIMAKDGKYMSHGSSCGCMECGGETVRGMGRAYQGSTRPVKIR
jgi:hypothetical protein